MQPDLLKTGRHVCIRKELPPCPAVRRHERVTKTVNAVSALFSCQGTSNMVPVTVLPSSTYSALTRAISKMFFFSTTGRTCQDVRVAFTIERAGTGFDDAVPQRYNLSMCAFKVLSSCPRDVSYWRQAAENDILMRKWETPLPCGSHSTGFLPLVGLLQRHFLRAHHQHTDADLASHRVRLWRGGSASKVPLHRLSFRRVRLRGRPEQRKGPWLLLWSRGEMAGQRRWRSQLLP